MLKGYREKMIRALCTHHLKHELSLSEKNFLQKEVKKLSSSDIEQMRRKEHSLITLMWALGLTDKLCEITQETSQCKVEKISYLEKKEFLEKATLRESSSLESQRDKVASLKVKIAFNKVQKNVSEKGCERQSYYYLLKEAEKLGIDLNTKLSLFGKPLDELTTSEYILGTTILEDRLFTLNWLCGYSLWNMWDSTPRESFLSVG